MSLIKQPRPVIACLTNADTFPYTLPKECYGISVLNQGAELTITLSTGITVIIPQNTTFEDHFFGFKTIDAAGSANFKMEVR